MIITKKQELLDRVAHGERIIIGKAGKPIARLEPFSNTKAVHRQFEGGGLRLQEQADRPLTPEYISELAASKYGNWCPGISRR